MLSLRAHLVIAGAILAAIFVLATIGNALEAGGMVAAGPRLRLASIATFLFLAVALAFAAIPVMVKLVLGFQVAIGNAGRPAVAAFVARERTIVFILWGLLAVGLVVAIAGAIVNDAFG
ncbi:MAG TPA: hypothetical protein VGF34_16095 [Stellaceae bacterium]|jgi:hypothetical protein